MMPMIVYPHTTAAAALIDGEATAGATTLCGGLVFRPGVMIAGK